MNDKTDGQDPSGIQAYVGREVVLDTKSTYVCVGSLRALEGGFFVLEDADVHDCSQGRSGKELYILDAKRVGIVPNRERVLVRESEVVSVSALEDVSG